MCEISDLNSEFPACLRSGGKVSVTSLSRINSDDAEGGRRWSGLLVVRPFWADLSWV